MEIFFLLLGFLLAAIIRFAAPAPSLEEQIEEQEHWDRHIGLGG